ncbi:MAG: hypothetical protein ACLFUJ_09275 [Phycisphaerae bacterium]
MTAQEQPAADATGRNVPRIVVGVAIAVTAAAAGLAWQNNPQLWWDLVAGEWILAAKSLPSENPFSLLGERWVNISWLWQALVAGLSDLVNVALLQAALVLGMCATVFLGPLRRRRPGWVGAVALLLIISELAQLRLGSTMLAGLLTGALIASIQKVLDEPRSKWLWSWPIWQLLWVNVDPTWPVGLAMIASTVAVGAICRKNTSAPERVLCSREGLAVLLASVFVTLLNPWLVDIYPATASTWSGWIGNENLPAYLRPITQHLLAYPSAVLLFVLAGLCLLGRWFVLPRSHVFWMAAATGAVLASAGNLLLAGPVWAFLAAHHGALLLDALALRKRRRWRGRGRWIAAAAVAVVAAAMTWSILTGRLPVRSDALVQTGAGTSHWRFGELQAEYLRDTASAGDIYCIDLTDAGVFAYYSLPRLQPQRKVLIDSRQNLFTPADYKLHNDLRSELSSAAASTAAVPSDVRFIYVSRRNPETIESLSASWRFDPVRISPAGVLFARSDWQGGYDAWRPTDRLEPMPGSPHRPRSNLQDYVVRGRPTKDAWQGQTHDSHMRWAGHVVPVRGMLHLGSLSLAVARGASRSSRFSSQGDRVAELAAIVALRQLLLRQDSLIDSSLYARAMLADAHRLRSRQMLSGLGPDTVGFGQDVIDLHLSAALRIYGDLDLPEPYDRPAIQIALAHVRALHEAGFAEQARARIEGLFEKLPGDIRAHPPKELTDLRNRLREQVAESIRLSRRRSIQQLGPQAKAIALASAPLLLRGRAIEVLQQHPSADTALLLGDLLLQAGRVGQAKAAYGQVGASHSHADQAREREILAEWVAAPWLDRNAGEAGQQNTFGPTDNRGRFYKALMLETAGRFRQALSVLPTRDPADPVLARRIDHLRRRLQRESLDEPE